MTRRTKEEKAAWAAFKAAEKAVFAAFAAAKTPEEWKAAMEQLAAVEDPRLAPKRGDTLAVRGAKAERKAAIAEVIAAPTPEAFEKASRRVEAALDRLRWAKAQAKQEG